MYVCKRGKGKYLGWAGWVMEDLVAQEEMDTTSVDRAGGGADQDSPRLWAQHGYQRVSARKRKTERSDRKEKKKKERNNRSL
jgi:hypothetical protein